MLVELTRGGEFDADAGVLHITITVCGRLHIRFRSKPIQALHRFKTASSYVVLRLDPAAHEWLESARRRTLDAPDPVRALLTGRLRVEVGPAEAERALAWATQLPGWHQDGRPALSIYTPGEMLVTG